jgi:hypothetical protein
MTGPERARAALGATGHPARAVDCPRCGARPWVACTAPTGRRLTAGPHPARVTAWSQRKEARPS